MSRYRSLFVTTSTAIIGGLVAWALWSVLLAGPATAPKDPDAPASRKPATAAKPAPLQNDRSPAATQPSRHTNRLAHETSPYLRLHAHNPVDWHPWGPAAFQRAKKEGKPIFLSIGYSSCYWCHVMERESFSDPEIARLMNELFINIKVDREERPDVDEIYMAAQQLIGRGGWPLSMFLTPDGRPFFGGTYFPPHDRRRGVFDAQHAAAQPGFTTILDRLHAIWRSRRPEVEQAADKLVAAVRQSLTARAAPLAPKLELSLIDTVVKALADEFDAEYGGFGFDPDNPRRPKFPEPGNLQLLLHHHLRTKDAKSLDMLTATLDAMARGGIRDHIGGGFHRYSTNRQWSIPHFEKMLYDNAQLAGVYLAAYRLTHRAQYAEVARETLDFVLRELTAADGGFYTALDAESEHEEGKFYVWTVADIDRLLGEPDARLLGHVYGLDRGPNFEGQSLLLLPATQEVLAKDLGLAPAELQSRLQPLKAKLLAAREKRPRPLLDTKILAAWNGLMIAAFADGAETLSDARYLQAAQRAADFVLSKLRTTDGRLLRTYAEGQAKLPAYLEDYACLVHGLLALDATGRARPGAPAPGGHRRWLQAATELTDLMVRHHADQRAGGFFYTADDHEELFARSKSPFDGALPSGNSLAVRNFVELYRTTREKKWLELARRTLDTFGGMIDTSPTALTVMAVALGEYLDVTSGSPTTPARHGTANADGKPKPAPGLSGLLSDHQSPDASAKVLQAEARLSRNPVAPGAAVDAEVRLKIADPWHINANPAADKLLIPTTLSITSDLPVETRRIVYPKGELLRLTDNDKPIAVYRGDVTLRAQLRIPPEAKPGAHKLTLTLRYQPCDDRRCLPPETLKLELPIEVAPQPARPTTQTKAPPQ